MAKKITRGRFIMNRPFYCLEFFFVLITHLGVDHLEELGVFEV